MRGKSRRWRENRMKVATKIRQSGAGSAIGLGRQNNIRTEVHVHNGIQTIGPRATRRNQVTS
jgi:hypothetical protein